MARNDPLEVRVEKMAQWASGIEEQIKELESKITFGDHALADALSAELGDLYAQYSETSGVIRDAELRRVEIAHEVTVLNDTLDVVVAQTALDVSMEMNEKGKPTYTNETARKNALTVRLSLNEEYTARVAQGRELELESMILKAQVEDWERGLSEYRNRNRALVARLNNLTARLGG